MSLILGLLASIVPNLVFRVFCLSDKAVTPGQVLKYFYFGAGCKFIGCILLCGFILQLPHLHSLAFLIAFMVAELVRWFYGLVYYAKDMNK